MDGMKKASTPANVLVIVGVAVALVVILLLKTSAHEPPSSTSRATSVSLPASRSSASSITSVHNDATADYVTALKSGRPIYVLFHSLTCQPCVEISAVADRVLPAYRDQVVFVNAITDDASSQQLAAKFSFQYIPTSFFVKPDGTVLDSYTGVLSEADMKARLDTLAAQ